MKEESEKALPVFDPVRGLTVDGELYTVRELAWKPALKFLTMLSGHAGKFLNERGELRLKLDELTALITQAGELAEFLILQSVATGRLGTGTLTPEQLDRLPFVTVCELLDAAISVNLSPEVLSRAKKPAGRLAQVLGVRAPAAGAPAARTTPLSPPSTSSSGRGTATPISTP